MDMLDLRYLVTVAHAGNLGRAAQVLGVQTSSVCRRLRRMEDALGRALFARSKPGVQLTAGGKNVLASPQRALAAFDAVRQA